ncbi:nose resistant to fluoxetine protein 6-like [Cydia strobilella]|uniref:nose resistant to fluoxetine protein 6-like n=1 Tax=Cydia strobilella TaxID=1100964 RepID=UPI003006D817
MKFLLLMFLVHQSSGVIYHLNFTEYVKMPELYHMDDYDTCIVEPGGTYCLFDADIYSKDNSELMQMIKEYTAYDVKHYNHTVVHRALCVQKTCKEFMQNRSLENEEDLNAVLEECVDAELWKGYKLNARLSEITYCKKHGEKSSLSIGDYVVGGVYLILIILNAAGTSYDILKGEKTGNPYLMAFSMRKNWRKLVAPSGQGPEPRLNRLKLFNGLRALTMICVFFSHTALVLAYTYLENPYYIETSYDDPSKYILFNGNLVTYTFFVMSGFLLAFNFELHAEKHRISLWDWPKGMLMRWLRLTPIYALVMFTVMTLMRHLGDGPLWPHVVTSEAVACNQYWWAHLLYINNYIFDDSHCFPQSWYLAADTQLFGLGLLVCILFRKPRAQIIALTVMLIVALAIPAAHLYFQQNLGAVVHLSPETYRSLFRFNDTFRIIFVAGHTNMSTYSLGIAGGLLTYHLLKNEKSVSQKLQVSWTTLTYRSLFRFNDTFRIIFVVGHTNMSTYALGIAGGLLTYHLLKNEKSVSQKLQVSWTTLSTENIHTHRTYRSLFRFNDTFRIIFVVGHTNMSTYALGIAGGLLTYHLLKNEKSVSQKLQKYPWIMWMTFPVGVGTILSGGIFYMDGYEPSTLLKIIYGATHKPLFQCIIIFIIIACIFKVETVYRGILEWRGFTWMGRASYAGFLMHSLFQRGLVGSQRLPSYMSDYNIMVLLAATIFLAFASGALLWVTVESPLATVTKTMLSPPRKNRPLRQEAETEDAKGKDFTTKV